MKVLLSPMAKQDLIDIKLYITNNLSNSIAAASVVSRITKQLRNLAEVPRFGSPLSSIVDVDTDYRYLLCGNYTAFYRIEDKIIYVDQILYGRRNFMKILFGISIEDE